MGAWIFLGFSGLKSRGSGPQNNPDGTQINLKLEVSSGKLYLVC